MSSTFHGLSEKIKKRVPILAAYAAWILILRLLCLSFVVYFLTRQGRSATFEEINESFSNNEIIFIGLSSGLFLLLLKGLAPLIDRSGSLDFSYRELASSYLPGFLQGAALATSIVLGFLLVGTLRFVGFFVQIEDTPLVILGIICRIGAFLAIGLCEEYIFRSEPLSGPHEPQRVFGRILTVALVYCVVKLAQFQLSWMHCLTLFLFSTALSIRRLTEKSFWSGAGFWSGVLIVFHPIFSLPVFGSDFSGIFLLKYQSQTAIPSVISGGPGGPLSSVAFQAILLIEIARGLLACKKSLFKATRSL
jgi:hypothetical protein